MTRRLAASVVECWRRGVSRDVTAAAHGIEPQEVTHLIRAESERALWERINATIEGIEAERLDRRARRVGAA